MLDCLSVLPPSGAALRDWDGVVLEGGETWAPLSQGFSEAEAGEGMGLFLGHTYGGRWKGCPLIEPPLSTKFCVGHGTVTASFTVAPEG